MNATALSMKSDALCEQTAVNLLSLIKKRDISCVELMDSCIERYEQVNHSVNAIVETNFENALSVCRHVDDSFKQRLTDEMFLPIPIGIKDLNDVAGMKTTYGSPLFKDNQVKNDDDIVAHLKENSAIIFGKTNVPEHGFGATTTNPLQGSTGNPFNPSLSAGASTGGGAAAGGLAVRFST